jgi:uroporphyrinogen III methyltransferase/synthase
MPSLGPLAGCRVLLTRPAAQADGWRRALEAAGAVVVSHPTVEVGPPPSWEPLDRALAQLESYHWLIFTSANAVRFTCERLARTPRAQAAARPAIAVVGAETARAVEAAGLPVARQPDYQRQEGLLAALADLRAGTRVLFPQAMGGRDELAEALRGRGCTVDVVPASQTTSRRDLPSLPEFDVATFASPSALDAFVAAHGTGPLVTAPVVAIGPTTASAARARGLRPLVAGSPSIEALIATLAEIATSPRSPEGAP